jgi:hypothetical protein
MLHFQDLVINHLPGGSTIANFAYEFYILSVSCKRQFTSRVQMRLQAAVRLRSSQESQALRVAMKLRHADR